MRLCWSYGYTTFFFDTNRFNASANGAADTSYDRFG